MKRAFGFAARARLPHLAAYLLKKTTRVLIATPGKPRYRVLALNVNKDGVLSDVHDCFYGSSDFEVICWPTVALPSMAETILSPKVNNNTYMEDDPEIEASKNAYRAFLTKVWLHLSRVALIDAVLAPNFNYSAQREFAAVLEESGTPFIVLHKENLKSPGRVQFWHHMYANRGTFSGRKILVYNDIERKLQLDTKVTSESRLIVTGMPRMDRIHRWRRANAGNGQTSNKRQLLFFAFDRKDKLPAAHQMAAYKRGGLKEQWSELTWNQVCEETHRAVVEIARRRPDITVVVKTKNTSRQRDDVNQMLKAAANPLPPNLTVINGGDAFKMLTESSVVIGFNTTGQLEAIAAGKPVIVPRFAEAVAPCTRDFAIDLGQAVEYAHSPEELIEAACRFVDGSHELPVELTPQASEALIRWTGNHDGTAGARVLEAIRSEIERTPTRQPMAKSGDKRSTGITDILFFLLRLAARWRLPRLASQLLLLTSRRLPVKGSTSGTRGGKRYRALIMTRVGLLEDIEESFRVAQNFDAIHWPSFALKAFASAILAPDIDHNNYITEDPQAEQSKSAYRRFLADVWRHYSARCPVDIALTGNFAYFTEREFATVLEEAGTPFVALHKENVRPPRRVNEYWFTLYKERRGKFTGRKILVYNEIERELEIATGVAQREQVVVTGAPRLDRLHRWRKEYAGKSGRTHKPAVLFFAFSRDDKLTAILRKSAAGVPGNMEGMKGDWGKLSWGQFCVETHRTIIDLARTHPDVSVFVKSKGQSRKVNDLMQILDDIEEPPPGNLKVITSGDPYELITQCDVVVGFNTTGLLEAIAAGKPVIVPFFGEAQNESMRDLIIDLGGAVEYAHSPTELTEMICRYLARKTEIPYELPTAARQTLSYWVGNDDGEAGRRVMTAIKAEIAMSGA